MTTNPFGQWTMIPVGEDGRIPAFSVATLVQSTLSGSVDDEITEHAVFLFDELDERGPGALREAALVLLDYLSATPAARERPQETAAKYEAGIEPDAPESSVLMSTLLALRLREGEAAAAARFDQASPELARGVNARMFVLAALASGLPADSARQFFEDLRIS